MSDTSIDSTVGSMTDEGDDESIVWETALAAEAERVLSQTEIDRLLNLDDSSAPSKRSVIDQIVNSSFVNYDRLPMLDVVFDRLVRLLNTSFRNLTSGNVEVSVAGIQSVRFGDFLYNVPLPSLISVVKAEEWDSNFLLTVDSELIYSIVDILLGGRRSEPAPIDGRPYTVIERALAERVIKLVLKDLGSAFAPLSAVRFLPERVETNPQFAVITRSNNATITARFQVQLDGRGGFINIAIPYAALEPVRDLLLQMFMGEKFGRDSMWESHLKTELRRTNVDLSAVLASVQVSLTDLLSWKKGTELRLELRPDAKVTLSCGQVPMFQGDMGQRNGRLALRIDADLGAQDEVIHGLLNNR
ncbi:flagellar motor switch protein FliM [Indioceanicola profundi]|uniref:flagellar motor switch protein FliM n=1 Tax=Indioceanicola profundi TaxID=2220096 RepID=UPI000E6AA0DD|nr:flagellar motor switch protein FliM [Indioceanicola profundi]